VTREATLFPFLRWLLVPAGAFEVGIRSGLNLDVQLHRRDLRTRTPFGRQHNHTRAPRVAHRSRTTSEKGSQFAKLSGGHGAGDGHAPSDGSSQKKLTSDSDAVH